MSERKIRVNLIEEQTAHSVSRQIREQGHKLTGKHRKPKGITSPYDLPVTGWNERPMRLRVFNEACERERRERGAR
jgi:hypothetical protein